MRVIGLDVHRNFGQVAILDEGVVKDHGRFAMEREAVLAFANKVLTKEDDVVLEATGNTAIIVRLLTPFVRRVVIANALQVRAIAWAKVKTDKIDAASLARLHAAQFLPEVWMPPEDVELQRRVIAERTQLVGQMTRLKNRVQSILHANLVPKETGNIFSKRGRGGSRPCLCRPTKCGWHCVITMNSRVWPPNWPSSTETWHSVRWPIVIVRPAPSLRQGSPLGNI